jgi:hypothetical protein
VVATGYELSQVDFEIKGGSFLNWQKITYSAKWLEWGHRLGIHLISKLFPFSFSNWIDAYILLVMVATQPMFTLKQNFTAAILVVYIDPRTVISSW